MIQQKYAGIYVYTIIQDGDTHIDQGEILVQQWTESGEHPIEITLSAQDAEALIEGLQNALKIVRPK